MSWPGSAPNRAGSLLNIHLAAGVSAAGIGVSAMVTFIAAQLRADRQWFQQLATNRAAANRLHLCRGPVYRQTNQHNRTVSHALNGTMRTRAYTSRGEHTHHRRATDDVHRAGRLRRNIGH